MRCNAARAPLTFEFQFLNLHRKKNLFEPEQTSKKLWQTRNGKYHLSSEMNPSAQTQRSSSRTDYPKYFFSSINFARRMILSGFMNCASLCVAFAILSKHSSKFFHEHGRLPSSNLSIDCKKMPARLGITTCSFPNCTAWKKNSTSTSRQNFSPTSRSKRKAPIGASLPS